MKVSSTKDCKKCKGKGAAVCTKAIRTTITQRIVAIDTICYSCHSHTYKEKRKRLKRMIFDE